MAELMHWAHLAVSAGGGSLYELAAAGLPAVAVQVAGNQERNIEGFRWLGTIQFAGTADLDDLPERVASLVAELKWDAEARQRMARAGRQVVDGTGLAELSDSIIDTARGAVRT